MESIDGYIALTKEIGKCALSAVSDVEMFIQRNMLNELVNIELTLPTKYRFS